MSRFLTPHAADLPSTVPFVGPETQERAQGFSFRARLGANENLFGPSPKAIAAMKAAVDEVWKYADPENHDLKQALAAYHGIDAGHFAIGGGIDGLLGLICRLVLEPGTKVVTSLGAYPTFNFHVAGFGGHLIRVPYRDDKEDPGALLDVARREGAKVIYLANPDNPMGTWHRAEIIEEMIANLPDHTLLVLDEAYCDLAPEGVVPKIDPNHPQVIRFRTFSKGYGMAGARVGYAIAAPDLAKSFDKVRNHFGMGRIGQIGAVAAVQDQAYLQQMRRQVAEARERVYAIARTNGLAPIPSATNFVSVDCGRDGAFARSVLRECVARGLFIRMPGVPVLDRCIRISLGDPAAMDLVAEILPQALAAAG